MPATTSNDSITDSETHPARGSGIDVARLSTRFGLAFTACQLVALTAFSLVILPKGGLPTDPVLERGHDILAARHFYIAGNYALALSGMLLLGFLGVVGMRLRRADPTGVLAGVAVAAGTLLALLWPLAAVIHDVFLDIAKNGADLSILAGADGIAPYSLALSALPRVFFLGTIVLGLRAEGASPLLQRTGWVVVGLSLLGSATVVTGAMFPLLALSSMGFELWVGALAWTWLRQGR